MYTYEQGYAGNYTAQYVEATDPLYAVGEYFDTNKDLLSNWINERSVLMCVCVCVCSSCLSC